MGVVGATLVLALSHASATQLVSAQAPSPVATPSPAPAAPDLTPFDGLGVWIDIYDAWAFANPVAMVKRAKSHDVQTVFVETSNYSRPFAIFVPAAMARLIRAAHVRGMDVVAWYLPGFIHPAFDFRRSMAAIHFHGGGRRWLPRRLRRTGRHRSP